MMQEQEILEYLSWADFRLATESIIAQITDHEAAHGTKFCSVYGLPRGGLCLAVLLSYHFRIPLLLEKEQIRNTTLIVDDCTNTGKTLTTFLKDRPNKSATIYHKPKSAFTPTFYFKETHNTVNYCWENEEERN